MIRGWSAIEFSEIPLTRDAFTRRFGRSAVIGMIHLLPLPGSPLWRGSIGEVVDRAAADAEAIFEGGADGAVIENFGDVPFAKEVGPETVAAMTAVISAIDALDGRPFGINVLRNDPIASLAIAVATRAAFIRVNVHAGAMITDQGIIEGNAAGTLRRRSALGSDVQIFADFRVKHAMPLAAGPIDQEVSDLRKRALADAILLTGSGTSAPVDPELVESVRRALPDAPLLVASGVRRETVRSYLALADGVIVGSSLKRDGRVEEAVDPRLVTELVDAAKKKSED